MERGMRSAVERSATAAAAIPRIFMALLTRVASIPAAESNPPEFRRNRRAAA
jgi:hypothetical protein